MRDIRTLDMFAGIGGFRSGLERIGGFSFVGHCEIDKYANQAYEAIYQPKGELYYTIWEVYTSFGVDLGEYDNAHPLSKKSFKIGLSDEKSAIDLHNQNCTVLPQMIAVSSCSKVTIPPRGTGSAVTPFVQSRFPLSMISPVQE